MHEKADSNKFESRGNVRIDYSVPCGRKAWTFRQGYVVEFHKMKDGQMAAFSCGIKRESLSQTIATGSALRPGDLP